MRIAIIGSGIAGLSAAWALSSDHAVTLFEAHPTLGMDAHSLDVPDGRGGSARVDVPLRVFHEGYYPTLARLYREARIPFAPIDSSASFTTADGRLLFRYANARLGRRWVPWVTRVEARDPRVIRLAAEIGWFMVRLPSERRRADVRAGVSLDAYLAARRWSRRLVDAFLVPAVAGICTCSYATVRRFPARVVLDYLDSPRTRPMLRPEDGARDVTERLTARVSDVRLSTPVHAVRSERDGVLVTTDAGVERFDHAVFATQANQVGRIATLRPDERATLDAFAYETSALVVHTDPSLAPNNRQWWSPVNYVLDPSADAPMTTVVLSDLHPTAWTGPPVFQTWNPYRNPAPGTLLREVRVERAVVDAASDTALSSLHGLHAEPDRRVWFCGSYASRGMTLQEAAAASAVAVAQRIGGGR